MIQLTVTDTLQNFTNDYVFQTQHAAGFCGLQQRKH